MGVPQAVQAPCQSFLRAPTLFRAQGGAGVADSSRTLETLAACCPASSPSISPLILKPSQLLPLVIFTTLCSRVST